MCALAGFWGSGAGASLHCAMRREISPCICRREELGTGTIMVVCQRISAFEQIVRALADKFNPETKISLEVSYSQIPDLNMHTFRELHLSITKLKLNFNDLRQNEGDEDRELSRWCAAPSAGLPAGCDGEHSASPTFPVRPRSYLMHGQYHYEIKGASMLDDVLTNVYQKFLILRATNDQVLGSPDYFTKIRHPHTRRHATTSSDIHVRISSVELSFVWGVNIRRGFVCSARRRQLFLTDPNVATVVHLSTRGQIREFAHSRNSTPFGRPISYCTMRFRTISVGPIVTIVAQSIHYESNQRMSAPKVRVVKKKATAKTHPIDMPIENVNGEGSGQNYVEAPDQNNEERSDQNSVEILYQNNEERPDKKAKGFPGNRVRS
ncbi:hypothetical protein EVAR_64306_1 [Eumeta japonica]|uniref:Uncharacterized protein n=1 Tax=Eumeta variegata TaxID=151549 RepID=A0A4C2A6Y0_EUMVA|nr:hypothetical protein EVAR_64306_1 [Eumeta japonica]